EQLDRQRANRVRAEQESLRWAEVVRLGQEGWELVSVQPLMRGVTEIGNQNAQGWAWGVALPVSYLLFFKRATS
ncbi:hypothetical protein ACLBVR_21710, partial [Pseudomonas aeruginosa]